MGVDLRLNPKMRDRVLDKIEQEGTITLKRIRHYLKDEFGYIFVPDYKDIRDWAIDRDDLESIPRKETNKNSKVRYIGDEK